MISGEELLASQRKGPPFSPSTFSRLQTESSLEIVLLQALPEKERMELIIQKGTELGVSMIIPFESERSISLKEREKKQKKAHRWQHVAIKAMQQSRRARVPRVRESCSFTEALEFSEGEESKDHPLGKERRASQNGSQPTSSPEDLCHGGSGGRVYGRRGKTGSERGFIAVELGQRILRTETAAITLMGILQYALGDLG